MEKAESWPDGITSLFKVLSKPDALRLFFHTVDGIKNSTYAIDELDLTPKKYYARLRELVEIGLVRKSGSVYGQTALGRMIYDRFLPSISKAVDARDELEFLVGLEGLEMENGVRKSILEELGIPIFTDSANLKVLRDYEALTIEVIDLFDSAEESIILASNHLDIRVLDANFRSMNRGVKNSFIIGRDILSSKLQQLKMMLSPKLTMAMIKLASNPIDMNEIARVTDIPFSFCVVDGYINIVEISNAPNISFITAFYVKNSGLGKKLANLFETLWKAGEIHPFLNLLSSFKK